MAERVGDGGVGESVYRDDRPRGELTDGLWALIVWRKFF